MSVDGAYSARFAFISDNVFLVAKIDPKSNRQYLIFEKMNSTTKNVEYMDSLECIHTAITQISYEEYSDLLKDPSSQQRFLKDTLNARSTEQLKVINLNIDEKWFAFKSWVQGIAEAGNSAFRLQSDIDNMLNGSLPIAHFLFRNMLRIDPSFFPQFIHNIEKECRFEGYFHKSSMHANLNVVVGMFAEMFFEFQGEYRDEVFVTEDLHPTPYLIEILVAIADLDAEYLFTYDIDNIEIYNPKNINPILLLLTENPVFYEYPEYELLLSNKNFRLRRAALQNPNCIKFEKFKSLFPSSWGNDIYQILAHPDVTNYPEFEMLASDPNSDIKNAVKYMNISLPHARWKSKDIRKRIKEMEIGFTGQYLMAIEKAHLCEGEAHKKELHKHLKAILDSIACTCIIDEDREENRGKLITGDYEDAEEIIECLIKIANIDADYLFRFNSKEKYDRDFYITDYRIRKILASREEFTRFPEYRYLFNNSDVLNSVASNPAATNFPEYEKLFENNFRHIHDIVARNPKAIKFQGFQKFFSSPYQSVKFHLARNPNAPQFPEFKNLFYDSDYWVRSGAKSNPNARDMLIEETPPKDWGWVVSIPSPPIRVSYEEFTYELIDSSYTRVTYAVQQLNQIEDQLNKNSNFDFLIELYLDVLKLTESRFDHNNEWQYLRKIAGIYFALKQYKSSHDYYNKSIIIENMHGIPKIMYGLMGGDVEAKKDIEKIRLREKNEDNIHRANIAELQRIESFDPDDPDLNSMEREVLEKKRKYEKEEYDLYKSRQSYV